MSRQRVWFVGGDYCGATSFWYEYQFDRQFEIAKPVNGYGFLPSPIVMWMAAYGRNFPAPVRVYSCDHPLFKDEVDRLRVLRKVDMLGLLGCIKKWGVLPVLREVEIDDVLGELELLLSRGYKDNGFLRRIIGEVRQYATTTPHLLVKGFLYEDPQE